jgi:hypothetical protein
VLVQVQLLVQVLVLVQVPRQHPTLSLQFWVEAALWLCWTVLVFLTPTQNHHHYQHHHHCRHHQGGNLHCEV